MRYIFVIIFSIILNYFLSFGLRVEKLNSGYLLENIAKVTPIRGKYVFEIILDANTVSPDFLKEIQSNVTKECEIYSTTFADERLYLKCNQWIKIWEEKVKQYMNMYESIFDQDFKVLKSRKRRELNWFASNIGSHFGNWYHKSVFGIMSHEDRVRQDKINSLYSTDIIGMYKKLNRSVIFSHKMAEDINKNSEILSDLIDAFSKNMAKTVRFHATYSIMDLSDELFNLQYMRLSDLNEVTRDLQKGFLNPKIIKDSEIIQEMKGVLLDVNEELFIDTRINDYNKILSIKKFSAAWQNKTLHILLPIPVIDKDVLDVIKIHPVPQINDNIVMTIDVTSDFIITSKDRSRYTKISQNNFLLKNGDCLSFEDRFYCERLSTFWTEEKSCIKNILSKNESSKCKIKAATITDVIVIPIKSNTFIITVSKRTQAKLIYTNRTIINLFFEGSTLMTEEVAATLFISTLEIHFFLNYRERIVKKLTFRSLKLNFDPMINEILNISRETKIEKFDTAVVISTEELSTLFTDIDEAYANHKLHENNLDIHQKFKQNSWIFLIVIIIIIILIIAGVCYSKISIASVLPLVYSSIRANTK